MNKQELKEIISDQNRKKPAIGKLVERDVFAKVEDYAKNSFIIIISGIRRSGKSTLLSQIRAKLPGYYFNFDDDRLVNFKIGDFQTLFEALVELYGEKKVFYFDEIQNISGWERFVRRLHDQRMKVFVTGSNASMLSKELGTHLTGRHLPINLSPFSFKEFLKLKEFKLEKDTFYLVEKKAALKKNFEEYFINGGFPEFLETKNSEYLKTIYENILYRDIIVRYKLSNEKALKELVHLAMNSIAKEISFNSIKNTINLGSSTTVKEYFNYLENSFLIYLLPKFDYSLKKQVYANKKVYVVDNALAINLGFRVSKDNGQLLENLIFMELKRKNKEVYYFSEKKECDFITKEKGKISQAIQVSYEINKENEDREINGLLDALNKFKLKKGTIITHDQEEESKIKGKKITILPAWKWLLENSE